jgi:uncharacterized protein (DUF1778 family)
MAPQKTKRSSSGGSRLMSSGKKPILLGLTPEQYAKIHRAAEIDSRPMTQFLTLHGVKAAEKILAKI